MSKCFSLIFLIQISKILSQIFSLYETSNDTIIYSSGLKLIELNKLILSPYNRRFNNITSDLIDVDLTIPSSIGFYQNNLDFATGYPEIISMIHENNIVGINNISLYSFHNENVFYPQEVIFGKPNSIYHIISNYSLVNCSYSNMNFKPIFFENSIKLSQFSKFEFFLQFTFGLYKNSICSAKSLILWEGVEREILIPISSVTTSPCPHVSKQTIGKPFATASNTTCGVPSATDVKNNASDFCIIF